MEDVTYYVGHESVAHRTSEPAMPLWQERFYAFMVRNVPSVGSFVRLPRSGVVEIGRIVEI